MRQPFYRGLVVGGAAVNAMLATGGRFPGGRWRNHRDADQAMFVGNRAGGLPEAGRQVHVRQAVERLHHGKRDPRRRAQPHPRAARRAARRSPRPGGGCARPASTSSRSTADGETVGPADRVDVIVNYTNCVQCGAITAKGGRLTTPEGGDGPLYRIT